ncbi:aldehyde dehydrogenase [Polaromonas sp. P1(28)-8]|nr:aldehyde dehydrogenase [Polaromonas sp. P1(28)-8]
MKLFSMYIDGAWREPEGGEWLDSLDPATGEAWARIPRGRAADAMRAAEAAHLAFTQGPWSRMRPTARGALLRKLADLLARDAHVLAELDVRDNGKPIAELRKQFGYLPEHWHYYAGLADKVESHVIPVDRPGVLNFTRFEPVGVVLAITPWNSPLPIASWKIAPALAAGCTVILKPSEHASASTLHFCSLVEEAGFPPGVVNVVTGYGAEVAAPLVEDPRVAKITFTGGEAGGRAVYELAAKHLKPVLLELGGKSPVVVFDDADLAKAVPATLAGIYSSSGQSCVAGSRLLLQRGIHDEFMRRLLEAAQRIEVGAPQLDGTTMGPISTRAQYDAVRRRIEEARADGAKQLLGTEALPRGCEQGWYVPPTVFADVEPDMRLWKEEVFGPVLAVIAFDSEEEAVRLANDSEYGLAAGVWTQDISRGLRMSEAIQAGTVWINAYRGVSSMTPLGGYKKSGFGRENGSEAMREYLQVKSVWVEFQ